MGQDGEGSAQSPHDSREKHRDRVVSRDEELRYLMAAPPLLKDVATILPDCGLRCPLSDIDIWSVTLGIPRLSPSTNWNTSCGQ